MTRQTLTPLPLLGTLALGALLLGACSPPAPAPVADDRWPGFDPADRGPIFFDFASLELHLLTDRRTDPGRIEILAPDGTRTDLELASRITNNDQLALGLFAPGELTLRLSIGEGADTVEAERRVTLVDKQHHGLAIDLRTPTQSPSALTLDLGRPTASARLDGDRLLEPDVRLFSLDEVLEGRRVAGEDPEGIDLAARLDAQGHLILEAEGLARGEHVVRIEPGGVEHLVWLAEGDNRIALEARPQLAELEVEFLLNETQAAPEDVYVHWVAPTDGSREPTVVAPNRAVYRDGRVRLTATPGPIHLLLNTGRRTVFQTLELPPEGLRGQLEL